MDIFRVNIFCIDFECLGVMRVRFGVVSEDRVEGGLYFYLEWVFRFAEFFEVEYRRLGL